MIAADNKILGRAISMFSSGISRKKLPINNRAFFRRSSVFRKMKRITLEKEESTERIGDKPILNSFRIKLDPQIIEVSEINRGFSFHAGHEPIILGSRFVGVHLRQLCEGMHEYFHPASYPIRGVIKSFRDSGKFSAVVKTRLKGLTSEIERLECSLNIYSNLNGCWFVDDALKVKKRETDVVVIRAQTEDIVNDSTEPSIIVEVKPVRRIYRNHERFTWGEDPPHSFFSGLSLDFFNGLADVLFQRFQDMYPLAIVS